MVALPSDVATYVVTQCSGRTDEALQSRFGISYNTFRRIRDNCPLRRSLAERLIVRVANEQGDRT